MFARSRSRARKARIDSLGRNEPRSKPATVQHLQPLAIDHVGLSPRHMAQLPRIDQDRLDAPFFQQLIERNPVHTGRFHRH